MRSRWFKSHVIAKNISILCGALSLGGTITVWPSNLDLTQNKHNEYVFTEKVNCGPGIFNLV